MADEFKTNEIQKVHFDQLIEYIELLIESEALDDEFDVSS